MTFLINQIFEPVSLSEKMARPIMRLIIICSLFLVNLISEIASNSSSFPLKMLPQESYVRAHVYVIITCIIPMI